MQSKLADLSCCDVFGGLMENAGKDDYAILAKKSGEFRFFVIQSRACRSEDEAILKRVPKDVALPRPLHTVNQIGIQFCPFCGTSLAELIRKTQVNFDLLSDEHATMVM